MKFSKQQITQNFLNNLWTFLMVACLGPFALPMLWRNPRYSRRTKIFISAATLFLTLYLLVLSSSIFIQIKNAYQTDQGLQNF